MRIREVGQKAENLIEQGEQVKRQQVYYQQATVNARNQLMSAYAMLDAASQTDEDGTYWCPSCKYRGYYDMEIYNGKYNEYIVQKDIV